MNSPCACIMRPPRYITVQLILMTLKSMVSTILLNARTFEETLRARAIQVYTLSSRNRQPEAIRFGLETLKKLGEDLPPFPSGTQVAFSMWRVKRLLRGMTDTSLLRLPGDEGLEESGCYADAQSDMAFSSL